MKPLWSSWPLLQEQIADAESLFLFLDYDGTLTSIADHPSKARLPQRTKQLLEQLASRPKLGLALISGRALHDLKRMVGLKSLCYVGNHGLELEGPQLRYINPVAVTTRPVLRKIAQHLRTILEPIRGVWVENKGLTLAVHYRSADSKSELLVKNGFYEVVQPYLLKHQVRVTIGKKIFEVRPPVRWTKGIMVNWLLARWNAWTDEKGILPVYVGDDETDEDAFKTLQARGITVVVGAVSPLTDAQYSVHSPNDVEQFLRRLLAVWAKKEDRDVIHS